MMFDTLVSSLSDAEDDFAQDDLEIFTESKSVCHDILRKTSYFDHMSKGDSGDEKRDPILHYLHKYYTTDIREYKTDALTDVGDLSWDEADLPSSVIRVWSFNDFMEQYNQIYAWLNSIQVQYHTSKKMGCFTPPVDSLLKDLEMAVEKREHFLRECGRMVGAFPELEEEVTWRVEHVIAKWDMLSKLRTKTKEKTEIDLSDTYSDIELEVRCLRRWLKEMEQRIDPLHISDLSFWSATDREKKMAEYQVLQTDIESHGRIVKLVLGLCEDLSNDPGLYDIQHAMKVAKSLEKRWHQIWLRSLEWQCLLENWIQDPVQGSIDQCDSFVDTDEEPRSKFPRLNSECGTVNKSPSSTLLRKKKRKRWHNSENTDQLKKHGSNPHDGSEKENYKSDQEVPELSFNSSDIVVCSLEKFDNTSFIDASSVTKTYTNGSIKPLTSTPVSRKLTICASDFNGPIWIHNLNEQSGLKQNGILSNNELKFKNIAEIKTMGNYSKKISTGSIFSQDYLEICKEELSVELTLSIDDCNKSESLKLLQEALMEINEEQTHIYGGLQFKNILSFGDDYRQFIESLSDSSVSSKLSTKRTKKFSRKGRKNQDHNKFLNETNSDVELEEACVLVSDSQKDIHDVELNAMDNFSQGFIQERNNDQYEDLLQKCSTNINILFNLLEKLGEGNSFVSQKKSREIRLLINRWKNLLHKVSDIVNHSKLYEDLTKKAKHIKHNLVNIEGSTTHLLKLKFDENQDLETRSNVIKDDIDNLLSIRPQLDELKTGMQSFLYGLEASSAVDDTHINVVDAFKEEVMNMFSMWEISFQNSKAILEKTEKAVRKIQEFEEELLELRNVLQKDFNKLKHQQSRKRCQTGSTGKVQTTSEDSGISDGSSWYSSEYDFPDKHERLLKLQQMARSLTETLGTTAPTIQIISKTLDSTASELEDLEKTYSKFKAYKKKRLKAKQTINKNERDKSGPKMTNFDYFQRRKTFAKITLTIQALFVAALFLSWLCQPKCCDNLSAISPFSPQLIFVNGPPPI